MTQGIVTDRAVLTIGTTESRNVVGLGLDLRLLGERGVAGRSVVVAVSAQPPAGRFDLTVLPPAIVSAQLAAIDPSEIDAVRIGALPSAAIVEAVADGIARFAGVPVVLDPVRSASAGGSLSSVAALRKIRERLLPLVTVALPNLAEASALAECEVADEAGMLAAARALVAAGARSVLVTGGHLPGEPVDLFVDGPSAPQRFAGPRLDREMRGTGCVLAISLAAELAGTATRHGILTPDALVRAIEGARATVRDTIAHARRVGDEWVAR